MGNLIRHFVYLASGMNRRASALPLILPFMLSFMLSPRLALAHGGGEARVEVELESANRIAAGKSQLSFQLVDTKLNQTLGDAELSISHEKKLHVFLYDAALKEFSHLHPEFDSGIWKTDVKLPINGVYFLWAQGEITSDGSEFSAFIKLEVFGGANAWPTPPTLTEQRIGNDDISRVTIGAKSLRAGRMAMLDLKFDRTDGSATNISPYLGALAHVVATPNDGDTLIHVHPMNGAKPNEGMLHVTFPTAGQYRLWVQFLDDGIVRTIPLAVSVR